MISNDLIYEADIKRKYSYSVNNYEISLDTLEDLEELTLIISEAGEVEAHQGYIYFDYVGAHYLAVDWELMPHRKNNRDMIKDYLIMPLGHILEILKLQKE